MGQKFVTLRTGLLAINAWFAGAFFFVSPLLAQPATDVEPALKVGCELLAQKRFKEAEDFFERIVSSTPQSVGALVNLAQVYDEEGKYTKAISLCDQVLSKNERQAEALQARAQAYLKTKQLTKAQADCDSAVQIAPAKPQSYCVRAQVMAKLERYKDALSDIDRAIALAPYSADFLCCRAQICMKLEQYERAVGDADEAIKLDAKLPEAYYYRGRSYREMGEKKLARQDLQKARALGFQD